MNPQVNAVIMGGGRGKRLYPLTKRRCKPAVPLAGKYRLVDIPISNCLNGGINKIYVLTQFNTASLHHHIQESYKFDPFGGGFVDILSAEQTEGSENWYQGTCDAVRQNLHHFDPEVDIYVILSGDQLYRLDLQEMIRQHLRTNAGVTIASKPLPSSMVSGLGLMRVKDDLSISEFVEKPTDPAIIADLAISDSLRSRLTDPNDEPYCMASMGIYVFNKDVLYEALDNSKVVDFGKELIPDLLGKRDLYSYVFDGYWEDIGTVRSFFEANLRLADHVPPFNFFDRKTIYTHARYLPASKINHCLIDHAIISDGCIISNATLIRCVIGVRSFIGENTCLEDVVMMGQDVYETEELKQENRAKGFPDVGVGNNCFIKNAIIDKNARIGDNVTITPDGKPPSQEDGFSPGYEDGSVIIRDGVIVIGKNAIIPDGTVV